MLAAFGRSGKILSSLRTPFTSVKTLSSRPPRDALHRTYRTSIYEKVSFQPTSTTYVSHKQNFDQKNALVAKRYAQQQYYYEPQSMLPHGWWGSLISPTLFALGVAGLALFYANSDEVKKRNRQKAVNAYFQGKSSSPLMAWWKSFSPGQQILAGIVVIDSVIFGLWKLPALAPVMSGWFAHSILSPRALPLLLSAFSHATPGHFLLNMIALYSFGSAVSRNYGKEQMVGIFIAGCMASSLASHYFKLLTRGYAMSLGASGGVFALVAASTFYDPDARLSIIFFPFISFTAGMILPMLVLFDAAGCVGAALRLYSLGLDHAGHLGGVAFGWFYSKYWVQQRRRRLRI